ncbi:unnamed protein product [Acanthoscelides obtectus]|uniref:Uncharacterized protein n=1 Tax=Acanthoscelides obtectus TaxID=200917 RepID=A0A9P0KN11_ACAOB|nr:unnamed protein product [Acanthoscelides obtectus]CAK1656518.1 hypothetical protein AOBTE_LOCUS19760 [Acanthoscelides obtectus]
MINIISYKSSIYLPPIVYLTAKNPLFILINHLFAATTHTEPYHYARKPNTTDATVKAYQMESQGHVTV